MDHIDTGMRATNTPLCARDRGDAGAMDFLVGDFTTDGAWHTLDLSGIIPAHAHAVAVSVAAAATAINKTLKFRTLGNANDFNRTLICTQAGNILSAQDIIVYPDANGRIEYNISPATWILITFCVKGWWPR